MSRPVLFPPKAPKSPEDLHLREQIESVLQVLKDQTLARNWRKWLVEYIYTIDDLKLILAELQKMPVAERKEAGR